MEITEKDIEHVAELAKLNLTAEEKKTYGAQLENIIGWMEELNKADISKAEADSYALGNKSVLREDIPEQFADTEALLKNAPDREFDFIKVKKVIN